MASTRRSPPAERDPAAVAAAVERALAPLAGRRLGIALSGGRDSVGAAVRLRRASRRRTGSRLIAIHVHHGLSPRADAWVDAVRAPRRPARRRAGRQARPRGRRAGAGRRSGGAGGALRRAARSGARRGVRCDRARASPRRPGRDAAAAAAARRGTARARRACRRREPTRTASRGCARCSTCRARRSRRTCASTASPTSTTTATPPRVIGATRCACTSCPRWQRAFPAASRTLARAAAHQADAARLLDEIARARRRGRRARTTRSTARRWPPCRRSVRATCCAGTCARTACRSRPRPASRRCSRSCAPRAATRTSCSSTPAACSACIAAARCFTRPPRPPTRCRWRGEPDLRLPHGRLAFVASHGEGLAAERLRGRAVTIARRSGGERFRARRGAPAARAGRVARGSRVAAVGARRAAARPLRRRARRGRRASPSTRSGARRRARPAGASTGAPTAPGLRTPDSAPRRALRRNPSPPTCPLTCVNAVPAHRSHPSSTKRRAGNRLTVSESQSR